jgi:hypothetical protein
MNHRLLVALIGSVAAIAGLVADLPDSNACSGPAYSPLSSVETADTVILLHLESGPKSTTSSANNDDKPLIGTIKATLRGKVDAKKTFRVVIGMCDSMIAAGDYVVPLIDGEPSMPADFAVPTSVALMKALTIAKDNPAKVDALLAATSAVAVDSTDLFSIMLYLQANPEVALATTPSQARQLIETMQKAKNSNYEIPKGWNKNLQKRQRSKK